MHRAITHKAKTILAVIGVLLLWWVMDYLIARPVPNIDVSGEAQYNPVLGKRFRTQLELVAIGYTMDRNYKKQIDYIALVKPPGFSGPEVVENGILPKGSVLEITAVLKADSWIMNRIQYVVNQIDGDPPLNGKMILDVDQKSDSNFGLPEDEFKLINENS